MSNDKGVIFSPYGSWRTAQGVNLTINTSGTYQLCGDGTCSSGTYESGRYSRLTVVLRDFLRMPEAAQIAGIIRQCAESSAEAANRRFAGLGPDDLEFDPANNLGGDVTSNGRPVSVSFDCAEGGSAIEFVKVSDFHDGEAAEELERLQRGRNDVPPPRVTLNTVNSE